ncbi:MAG: hypothetical protein CL678_12080 [Bdellovibrionaceae bacterium]|nr:hypothetical protein [Pseudobdellovibrionaceae bacterium]|tara:strand:+ start:13553 stop:14071 length:519 start_codon:yes stop_codon:yes gene_type:complete
MFFSKKEKRDPYQVLWKHLKQQSPQVSPFSTESLWKPPKEDRWSFFCPCCSMPRKIKGSASPTKFHVFQIALTSVLLTTIFWSFFEWKGIFSFVPLWIGFEVFYRIRMRIRLRCEHCGFDPYLYLTDTQKAKEEIQSFWKQKRPDLFEESAKAPLEQNNAQASSVGSNDLMS